MRMQGTNFWNPIPFHIKSEENLQFFKEVIKS